MQSYTQLLTKLIKTDEFRTQTLNLIAKAATLAVFLIKLLL
jgi:hypothetical protein